MADVGCEWSISNPGPNPLLVWLEPWAEEFTVPAKSTIILKSSDGSENCMLGQIEWTSKHLIVWASARTVVVSIDDVIQESASAAIPIPDGLTKDMLETLFADQPAVRLGGSGPS